MPVVKRQASFSRLNTCPLATLNLCVFDYRDIVGSALDDKGTGVWTIIDLGSAYYPTRGSVRLSSSRVHEHTHALLEVAADRLT
jgi:hypothetical protein